MLHVLAIICNVVGISHHLPPPPTKTQGKADSHPHLSGADIDCKDNDDTDEDAAEDDRSNDSDLDVENKPVTQMMDEAAADNEATRRQWTMMQQPARQEAREAIVQTTR